MHGFPVLSLILAAPFIGALIVMFTPRNSYYAPRVLSAIAASISLLASLYVLFTYNWHAGGFQFEELVPLIPALGIQYHVAVDGMSVALLILTAFIIFTGVFTSWTVPERAKEFYALLLLLVTGVFGVFMSLDLFLFFLFYELAVLPMYLLIGIWGSTKYIVPRGVFGRMFQELKVGTKEYSAMKLTLYLLFGSAFILVGILAIYKISGQFLPQNTFDFLQLSSVHFPREFQRIFFLVIYVGFGVLAGIWPLHTWSPDGHAAAPAAGSMMHAGVLMKLGAYGVVRVGMQLMPEGALMWAWLVGTIATINIVYGALSAMWQTDLKYIIAYSSVSHMGVVMLGAATLTEPGLNGSIFQMVAHGFMTGLMFALVGLVYEKTHTRNILEMGGLGKRMPGIATFFTIGGLSSLGLPALAGFVAEFLVFLGAWKSHKWYWLIPAVAGAFFTAVYVLRALKIIFWGPFNEKYKDVPDAQGPEWVSLVVLSGLLIIMGVLPFLLLRPINAAAVELLTTIKGVLP